jgi:hypothetical protein
MPEEQVVVRGQLEQEALHEVLPRRIGDHAQDRTDVPGRGLLGGSLDPRGGGPDEAFGVQRLGRLQGIEEDQNTPRCAWS